ncbi:hypothetical protein PIB30_064903 [Stylosanthes scabra]|uniref:Uncharacterized protein n=1 Tax=Stylosanthes scabra TaxID=79078 RepID=A0ABU6ZKK9_9FABA|nr:hypothetical protein [Stylosanthes scabra]
MLPLPRVPEPLKLLIANSESRGAEVTADSGKKKKKEDSNMEHSICLLISAPSWKRSGMICFQLTSKFIKSAVIELHHSCNTSEILECSMLYIGNCEPGSFGF